MKKMVPRILLSVSDLHTSQAIMSPQPKGGGDILFLVQIPSASASALLRFRALSFEPMDGF